MDPINYTLLIRKAGNNFVALCLELNVAAQGDTLAEARDELENAIREYRDVSEEQKVSPAPLDIETIREFLFSDDHGDAAGIEVNKQFRILETFATTIPAYASPSSV